MTHDNPRYVKQRDLLAEVLANEQMDRFWIPRYRATTERGLFRVVVRYLRDTGMDSHDISEWFQTPPQVTQVWCRIDNPDSDYPWTNWTQGGRKLNALDDGVHPFWQVQW